MAKTYWLKFGQSHATLTSGLSPTLVLFNSFSGVALTAPGITQPIANYGLYQFQYTPSFAITFIADGATTSLGIVDRYINGSLDPADAIDETVSVGNTQIATIGTTASSFGNVTTDPGTVMGYLKRIQEWLEGDATFTKATGVWTVSDRTSGTSLGVKNLSNNTTSSTKS